jgi:mono/diheme cytochrome c family protein
VRPRHPILSLAGIPVLAATLVIASCGGAGTPAGDPTPPAGGPRDAAQLFVTACASCHGPLGKGGSSGVPLNGTTAADRQQTIGAIRFGIGAMPAASDGMSDEQIKALADYVAGLR